MSVRGSIVVITGAGSGIGRGLAEGFCRDGAQVVGIGRTEADLAATAESVGRDKMTFVVGDVARAEDVERLVQHAEAQHGRIDVLINNAALYPKERFLESEMDAWAKVIDVNVVGMARCCHRVLPGMLERGHGRVINVGSFAWKGPIPTASAYSASKGAVRALTRGIAVEIDRELYPDVLVNELVPGVYRTRMTPDASDPPSEAYEHARTLVNLPAGGPHGETFVKSELHREYEGRRAKLKRLARQLLQRA